MIYLCFGVVKSASTFLYQITEEVLRVAGRPPARLGPPFRPATSLDNYLDTVDLPTLEAIARQDLGRNIVLKTHGPLDPAVGRLIEGGTVLASASIRDPREMALSMLDHGRRSRRWRYWEFSEYAGLADTTAAIDEQLRRFGQWAAIPAVQLFTYNAIAFDTAAVVAAVAAQIGVAVDAERVLAPFRDARGISQFSKGAALRYREMPAEAQAGFLDRYAALYAAFAFDTPEAAEAARRQGDRPMRPRGQVAQYLAQLRRQLRRARLKG